MSRLPRGALFGDVYGGRRVVVKLAQSEHVEGVVELAVASRLQAVAIGPPRRHRDQGAVRSSSMLNPRERAVRYCVSADNDRKGDRGLARANGVGARAPRATGW